MNTLLSSSNIQPAKWTPLVKPFEAFATEAKPALAIHPKKSEDEEQREPFVDSDQSVSIVMNVFIVLAAMIAAALLALLFYWSYQKDITLFVTILCGIGFIYSACNVIMFGVKSASFDEFTFKFFMGFSVFICAMNIILGIYFGIQSRGRSNDGAGGVPYQNMSSSQNY